ncbi:MAG: MGMT family protein [Elusimicrobia bacterium]|nr:MGMT family protein [Elusimicrobiota bacterium]
MCPENSKLKNKKIAQIVYPEIYQKIWEACAKIPKGKAATYAYLAAQIGKPKAARLVARAMAKNPYAPKVPCHRVVKSDGSLGGYSAPGGARVKKFLLTMEGVKFRSKTRVDQNFLLKA